MATSIAAWDSSNHGETPFEIVGGTAGYGANAKGSCYFSENDDGICGDCFTDLTPMAAFKAALVALDTTPCYGAATHTCITGVAGSGVCEPVGSATATGDFEICGDAVVALNASITAALFGSALIARLTLL